SGALNVGAVPWIQLDAVGEVRDRLAEIVPEQESSPSNEVGFPTHRVLRVAANRFAEVGDGFAILAKLAENHTPPDEGRGAGLIELDRLREVGDREFEVSSDFMDVASIHECPPMFRVEPDGIGEILQRRLVVALLGMLTSTVIDEHAW